MKILAITGSPRRHGNSSRLADEFIAGAEESGCEVIRFDAAFKKIHPCVACEKCHSGNSGCTFKDDMEELNPHLLEADGVVFASPIYYYGMNSQIRSVIDRFYANDAALHVPKKDGAFCCRLRTTLWNPPKAQSPHTGAWRIFSAGKTRVSSRQKVASLRVTSRTRNT